MYYGALSRRILDCHEHNLCALLMQPIQELLTIMARLRDPDRGCPWDIKQNFQTIAPYTIEEAYEVLAAIDANDMESLREELGDLLLQVIFHSQMAAEANQFNFGDVVQGLVDKLIRRHPHVFGEAVAQTSDAVKANWDAIKQAEKASKQQKNGQGADTVNSVMSDVPKALPALLRAEKIGSRAVKSGFDWPDQTLGPWQKLQEELSELAAAKESGDKQSIQEEIGDVLFCIANIAARHDIQPEMALHQSNEKFLRRFRRMEELLRQQSNHLDEIDFNAMLELWQQAKKSS